VKQETNSNNTIKPQRGEEEGENKKLNQNIAKASFVWCLWKAKSQ